MQSHPFDIKKIAIVCGTFVLASLIGQAPANAQEFPAQSSTKTETVYNSQLPLTAEQKKMMKPGVRYTVGSVTQKGWHKNLVKGNKNLGHYFWAPMNHMVQASSSNKTKVQYLKAPRKDRKFHYIKPVHKANPERPDAQLVPQVAKAKQIKYLHAPPKTRTFLRYKAVKPTKKVAASLSYRKHKSSRNVNARLISEKPTTKSYGSYNTSRGNASGVLSSKDAYGRILND